MPLHICCLLNDTGTDPSLISKQGLSLLLESGTTKILFDTGPDESYVRNAQAMGLDLADVSHVVLSHGHQDHDGGLPFFPHKTAVIAHPDVLHERFFGFVLGGCPVKVKRINQPVDLGFIRGDAQLTREAVWIDERFLFLGEIDAPHRRPYGIVNRQGYRKDALLDDSALVWTGSNGLVVIAGCAHSGICEILEYAKKRTGIDRIAAVVGGFHMRRVSPLAAYRTRAYFRRQQIPLVYACHCSGAWGRLWLGARNLQTGQRITLD